MPERCIVDKMWENDAVLLFPQTVSPIHIIASISKMTGQERIQLCDINNSPKNLFDLSNHKNLTMEIKQMNDSEKGMFFVEQNGKVIAEMTYVWAGSGKIIIEHTLVDDSLKGQGCGKQMLDKAVEFARQSSVKIVPLCPFVKSEIHKTPEYSDVLL